MAVTIYDWHGDGHLYADEVHVREPKKHPTLLGPNGLPLVYEKNPVGFDLTPRNREWPSS